MPSEMTLSGLFFLCAVVFYLLLIIQAARKLRIYKAADYLLVIYLSIWLVTSLGLFARAVGWLNAFLPAVINHFPLYGLLLSGGFIFLLTRSVLRSRRLGWGPLTLNLVLLAVGLGMDTGLIPLPEGTFWGGWVVSRQSLSYRLLAVSWGLFIVLSLGSALRIHRRSAGPFIRQRCAFWSIALVGYAGAAVLFLLGQALSGTALVLLSAVLLNDLVLTFRIPDLRCLLVDLLSHLTAGLIVLLGFALGFLTLEGLFSSRTWYQPLYPALFLVPWVLILYPTLERKVEVNVQLFLSCELDYQRDLRSFSRRLSSILDIDLLARDSVELISDVLDIKKVRLYLVDQVETEHGLQGWNLRAVKGTEDDPPELDHLPVTGPFAKVLVDEKRPLTHAELEMIPRYQTLPERILAWLRELEADTLVPVHTEDEWIGLYALSLKRTGASCTAEELDFLISLADQTAVALQNARLMENMTNLDHQLRRSRASTNTMLERISRIKRSASDFISLKAHELRTPLTVMSGYTQLLANDRELMEDEYYAKLVEGILSGSESLQKIIDNMLYTASIQPGAVQVDHEPVSLLMIIDRISRQLQEKVQARNITLSHDGLGAIPEVYGDSEALDKVFRYLINYAMTHTPSGGKINITGRHLPLRSDLLRWEGVEVVVRDTGIGIDSEAQERLFRDFSRPSEGSFDIPGGDALPGEKAGERLAEVRSIVEAHNGRIWVELLEKDKEHLPGSEFHVVLPLQQQTYPTRPVESQGET